MEYNPQLCVASEEKITHSIRRARVGVFEEEKIKRRKKKNIFRDYGENGAVFGVGYARFDGTKSLNGASVTRIISCHRQTPSVNFKLMPDIEQLYNIHTQDNTNRKSDLIIMRAPDLDQNPE